VTDFVTVFLPGWGAVESAGKDAFFKYQHTADQSTVTGAAFRYGISDLHEVRVPFWAHALTPYCGIGGYYTFNSKSDADEASLF
jgi:hypothetical protein